MAFEFFSAVTVAASPVATDLESSPPQPTPCAPEGSSKEQPFFSPSLTAYGEIWSIKNDGNRSATRWNTLVDVSTSLDLEKLGAPHGSLFVGQILWIENQKSSNDVGELTGAFNPVSGLHAGNQLRVFNLYCSRSWANDTCKIKVGQLAIDDDFMGSDYAALFANSSFGAMPSQVTTPLAPSVSGNSAYPVFPVAAPGVFLAAQASQSVNLQAGLYHGGPGPDERGNHGFDWDSLNSSGVVAFVESSWRHSLAGIASTLKAGTSFHSGTFANLESLNNCNLQTTTRSLYSVYVCHDLTLCANAAGHPVLGAFWRAGLAPQQDRTVVHTYLDAGFNWFGPFPSRPEDVLGLAVASTEFGREYRKQIGTGTLAGRETTLEFTYRAQLTAALSVQADLQVLGHCSDPADTASFRTTTVVGLRTSCSF